MTHLEPNSLTLAEIKVIENEAGAMRAAATYNAIAAMVSFFTRTAKNVGAFGLRKANAMLRVVRTSLQRRKAA